MSTPRRKPYIVGIAGGTGSGKTTLTQTLLDHLGKNSAVAIAHDSYYRDFSHLSPNQRTQINFDHPESLETELLVQHLQTLTQDQSVAIPTYDFTTHARTTQTREVTPRPIIIVEGILIFTQETLRKTIDLKIFIDTPADIRFIRRLNRDIEERGRTPQSVTEQYLQTVRPMHNTFVEPSRQHADLIVPGDRDLTVTTNLILGHFQTVLAQTT